VKKGKALAGIVPFLPMLFYAGLAVAAVIGAVYGFKYLKDNFGAGTPDPGGGAPSTGIIDGLLNATAEVGRSSLNYTGALQESVMSPKETIDSIVGAPTGITPQGEAVSYGHDATYYATFGLFGK
jgi:hypothetical protein